MRESRNVCACVLAAGQSRRMGECKLLRPFAGSTLLERILKTACDAAAQNVAVVTGAYREEMSGVLAAYNVTELYNPVWDQGQASSVRAAVQYADFRGFDALMLIVADQPFVETLHLDTLLSEYATSTYPAYLAATENRSGNPCLFTAAYFPFLQELSGDEGARALFRSHPDMPVKRVLFDDPHLFDDVDTLEDLIRLERMCAHG